jgi:type II secretory pathway component PulF
MPHFQIAGLGLRPVSLSEKAAAGAATGFAMPAALASLSFRKRSAKVSGRELENFTRLLSSLLAAGVPLSRALVILHKESASPAASAKWKEIHDLVIDGMSLADSMGKSPETFPRVYTAMVQAGETGGFLDLVLAQIADFQAREKELRSKVMAAMLYPSILFFLAIGVLIFLLTFFIPRFQGIFKGFGATLPIATQIVIGASTVVRSYGAFVVVGLVVAGFLLRTWFSSEFAMARFCRMLGTLLGAGVPLVQGLSVARKSIGNQILVDAVSQSIERVQQGGQLGASLAESRGLFPSSVVEMISVAEESGRLDQELVRIANVTEGDLDRELKTAVALMEPAMLFFIAAFIGTIFISMVLPIFTLQDYIK